MRTAEEKFDDLKKRGRTLSQIRAVSVALNDDKLFAMVTEKQKAEAKEEAKNGDAIKVKVERC